jgi:mannose-6-phosphate isomerase-like protein (cupin superfamily)
MRSRPDFSGIDPSRLHGGVQNVFVHVVVLFLPIFGSFAGQAIESLLGEQLDGFMASRKLSGWVILASPRSTEEHAICGAKRFRGARGGRAPRENPSLLPNLRQRVVTGGDGGVANVHVVKITEGAPHVHTGYDEVYYVLTGRGTITLDGETHPLRPGSVAVIPAGVPHSLKAESGDTLEFIIFGTPPMAMDDERARPRKV